MFITHIAAKRIAKKKIQLPGARDAKHSYACHEQNDKKFRGLDANYNNLQKNFLK